MKPVIIIAIAVGCSVVAVFGVSFAWQELEYQMALTEWEKRQESIVNAYNQEMERCRKIFVDYSSAGQCEENAKEKFLIHLLDDKYVIQLDSPYSEVVLKRLAESLKEKSLEFKGEQTP